MAIKEPDSRLSVTKKDLQDDQLYKLNQTINDLYSRISGLAVDGRFYGNSQFDDIILNTDRDPNKLDNHEVLNKGEIQRLGLITVTTPSGGGSGGGGGGGTTTVHIQYPPVTNFTNSIDRILNEKLGEAISILDFGANSDGVTDNTTAINNAIASAILYGGKRILIPAARMGGFYLINGPIVIDNTSAGGPIVLEGEGEASLLFRGSGIASGSGLFNITGTDIHFRNFKVDGNVTTPTGHLRSDFSSDPMNSLLTDNTSFWVHGPASNVTWRDVTVTHTGGYSILLDATNGSNLYDANVYDITDVKILDCNFVNNRPHLFGTSGGDENYGSWTGGIFANTYGIQTGSNYLSTVRSLLLQGSYFAGNTGICFWSHLYGFDQLFFDFSVLGCTFIDTGLDACQFGGVSGYRAIGNRYRRTGYIQDDRTIDISPTNTTTPKWSIGFNPVALDTSGQCKNGTYANNIFISSNGGDIDADGFGFGTITGNVCFTPRVTDIEYLQDKIAVSGPAADGVTYSYGCQPSNSNNTEIGANDVQVTGNTFINKFGGAVRMAACRGGLVSENNISHPDIAGYAPIVLVCIASSGTVNTAGTALSWVSGTNFIGYVNGDPIVINSVTYTISNVNSSTSITLTGSAGTQTGVIYGYSGAYQRTHDTAVLNNFIRWNPASSASCIQEIPNLPALFHSNDKNWVHGNQLIGNCNQFFKDAATQSSTGISISLDVNGLQNRSDTFLYRNRSVVTGKNFDFLGFGVDSTIAFTNSAFLYDKAVVGIGGYVNTTGTAVVWVSGDQFSNFINGGSIVINSVTYTILTVNSAISITLTGSAGTQAAVTFNDPLYHQGLSLLNIPGSVSTGSRTVLGFEDTVATNIFSADGFIALTDALIDQQKANKLPDTYGLLWYDSAAKILKLSTSATLGVRNWTNISGGGSSPPFNDSTAIIFNNADNTKLIKLDASLLTTATTRTIKAQDANYIIAGTNLDNAFSATQSFGTTTSISSGSNLLKMVDSGSNVKAQLSGGGVGRGSLSLGDGSGFTNIIKAFNGLAASVTWILPGNDGTSGYVLSTDGASNLSWIANGGGGGPTPGGSDTDVQYNKAGVMFGDNNLKWIYGTPELRVNGIITATGSISTSVSGLAFQAGGGNFQVNSSGAVSIAGVLTSSAGLAVTTVSNFDSIQTSGGVHGVQGLTADQAIYLKSTGGPNNPGGGYGGLGYSSGSTYFYWNGSSYGTFNFASTGSGVTSINSQAGPAITINAGTAISITNPSSNVITITNTGVTSNIAGTGIGVSSSTGAVTISNTGVVSLNGLTGTPSLASLGSGIALSISGSFLLIANTGVTNAAAGTGISLSAGTGSITISNAGVTALTGTANQVLVNGGAGTPQTGSITLTLPQSIGTGNSPQFTNLTLTGSSLIGGNETVSGFVQAGGNINSTGGGIATASAIRLTNSGALQNISTLNMAGNAVVGGAVLAAGNVSTNSTYSVQGLFFGQDATGGLVCGGTTLYFKSGILYHFA